MDAKKKAGFVKKMGKGRKRMARGGLIRQVGNRQYFDDGGTVLGGPSTSTVNPNATNPNTGLLGTPAGFLGLNNNYQAGAAQIQQGTTPGQLNVAYSGAQGALGNQGDLVSALQPQVPTAVANQNAVAAQELAMSNGEGPNPALNQLAQSTGENVANQAALMAGQRGASGNVGLITRQAAQQGAATQQQAAGEAATLEAEQQIAARNNLANISNNQISQTGQAITGQNSANQNEQAILQNANTSANNAAVGMQSNINNVNSQTSAANQNMASNVLGGITSAISSGSSLFAKGGEVGKDDHLMLAEMNAHSLKHAKKFADGGEVDQPDLGKFSAGDDSPSAPNIGSTGSLPADQTDLGKDFHQPSSPMGGGGGGGGGGGAGGLMALAALAEGGQIHANPLLNNQVQVNGPGNWAAGYFNSGSASNGPSIAGTSALPANGTKLQDSTGKGKKKQDPQTTTGQAGPWELGGGLAGGGDNGNPADLPSQGGEDNTGTSTGETMFAARGGVAGFCPGPHKSHVANYLAKGGAVAAMVSPGEVYLSPEKVRRVVEEGANPLKIGIKFGGKAKVKGDSLKNDTIPTNLEDGGVVIDREHVMSPEKAELFVHRALARKKARK